MSVLDDLKAKYTIDRPDSIRERVAAWAFEGAADIRQVIDRLEAIDFYEIADAIAGEAGDAVGARALAYERAAHDLAAEILGELEYLALEGVGEEPDLPITAELVTYELDNVEARYWDEDFFPPKALWHTVPEGEKLSEIVRRTSISALGGAEARQILAAEVDFERVPVEQQKEILGDDWQRLAPAAQCHAGPSSGMRAETGSPLTSPWPGATEQERIDAWERFRDLDGSGLTRAERDLYYHVLDGGGVAAYRLWTPDGVLNEFPAGYTPVMTFRAADIENAADMAKERFFDLADGAVLTDEGGNAYRLDGGTFQEFTPGWEEFRDVFELGSPAELKALFREWTEDYAARRAEDAERLERLPSPGEATPRAGPVPSVAEILAAPRQFLSPGQIHAVGQARANDNDPGMRR
jgi:hypothetical protein